jgi:hypothetical protein
MDDAFWQWAKTPRDQGGAGLQSGQRVPDATIVALQREWAKQSQKWEIKESGGNYVRMNPQTGLGMVITNTEGQPIPAPARSAGAMDPYAAYMNPPAVAGAAVDTNSAAFQGVQPSQGTGASAQGTANAVAPVNVNPAQPAAAPAAAPASVAAAAAKVYKTENEVIADARMGYLSKEQAQAILVNQFGLDP